MMTVLMVEWLSERSTDSNRAHTPIASSGRPTVVRVHGTCTSCRDKELRRRSRCRSQSAMDSRRLEDRGFETTAIATRWLPKHQKMTAAIQRRSLRHGLVQTPFRKLGDHTICGVVERLADCDDVFGKLAAGRDDDLLRQLSDPAKKSGIVSVLPGSNT